MSNNPVEKAFALIEQGHKSKKAGDLWEASDAFCQAQEILETLGQADVGDEEEGQKIAALYQQQAIEYRKQARNCFMNALQVVSENDEKKEDLTEEEALSRVDLFSHLFSKPIETQGLALEEQQSSLEERLMQLNQAIPSHLKSTEERMKEVNQGMNRLGLSLYSHADQKNSLLLPENKSESQQVDDIIAQAKDEVLLHGAPSDDAGVSGPTETGDYLTSVLADEDEDGLVDSDLDDDDADDASMSPQAVESIANKVADAQATLAELLAMLNESGQEDSSDPVLVNRAGTRQSLKKARVLLLEATKQLVES